ncbi:hypothetical protein B0I35DRAFT_238845 [Stachybotrys elegans]|uniref:Rhodopsin domain-containing protein n=1 Tax=Stachybotrys elegans TaxID=80388 RepID=A0A8K0SW50_9HYPO|nr:hypothetical protein B0I35DRAFT_238845 [Stachybotrys elegans]
MPFNVFDESLQGAVFLICVITVPICTLITILRFVGTKRAGRAINWDDWFALVALVSFWLHAAVTLWTILILNGRDRFAQGSMSPNELVTMSQVGYAMQLNFPVNPTFAKLSLLVLYFRIFSINRKFARWVWALAIIQICWFLAIFLTRAMFCIPVSTLWSANFPRGCIDPSLLLAAGESVNAAISFAMIALAMYMVRTLIMSSGTRWKLRALFVFGGITGIIDVVSIIQAYGTIELNLTYLCLVTIQFMANTICCCAPVYRSILPRMPFLGKIVPKLSLGYYNKSRSSKGGASDNSSELPTLVTIGGTTWKRGMPNQNWIQLQGERSDQEGSGWAGVENIATIESRGTHSPVTSSSHAHRGQGQQFVKVDRTYEVV